MFNIIFMRIPVTSYRNRKDDPQIHTELQGALTIQNNIEINEKRKKRIFQSTQVCMTKYLKMGKQEKFIFS